MTENAETRDMLTQAVSQMLERRHSQEMLYDAKPAPDLWDHLVELGLTAAEFPEETGGLGVDFADIVPSFHAIGRALATTYLTEFVIMGGWLVNACSNSDAARALAPKCAAGEARAALCFAEYGDGGDLSFTRTVAKREGAGWRLSGAKSLVVGGDRATHLIVPAMADDGLCLFLVPVDAQGISRHPFALYDTSQAADFTLDDVELSADALLAGPGAARGLVEAALDRGRAAMCHEISGLLEAVEEITLNYVKTRKQFGQPIGAFQTMQHRMADIYMAVELARSCAQMASDAISQADQTGSAERARTISAAMVQICTSAREVGQSAVQAHGGIALTREYLMGHYFKRLTMAERYLGDADYHLQRFIDQGEEPRAA